MYPQDPKNPNPNTHVRLQQVLTNIYRYYHDAMLAKWLTKAACIVQPTFYKSLNRLSWFNLVFVSPTEGKIQQVHKVGVFSFLMQKVLLTTTKKKKIKRVFTELTISLRGFSWPMTGT